MIRDKLHSCRTPSTFFMKGVLSEEWQCGRCGQVWNWAKTGFGDERGWHIVIGRKEKR